MMPAMFTDKTILITGGTGSFGKKCVEILLCKKQKMQLLEENVGADR